MERCPTCQARLKQGPICPRCRTDLSRLLSIESQAAVGLRQAAGLLAEGAEAQALAAVEASLRLKQTPLGAILRGYLTRPRPATGAACAAETPAAPEIKAQDADDWHLVKEERSAFLADMLARLQSWLGGPGGAHR